MCAVDLFINIGALHVLAKCQDCVQRCYTTVIALFTNTNYLVQRAICDVTGLGAEAHLAGWGGGVRLDSRT